MDYKKQISFLIFIVFAVTPLIITPFPFAFDFFYLPKIIFIYIMLALIVSIWFLNETNKLSNLMSIGLSGKIILIYLFLLVLSTIFSVDFNLSLWGHVLREEGLFAITAYILLFLFANKYFSLSDKYIKLIILSTTTISIYGISQYFNIDIIPRDVIRSDWSNMAFSTIGNPNFLGSFLVLILPLSIYQYFKSSNPLRIISISIIYLCLLMTFTRGAWLGALISFIIIVIYSFVKRIYIRELVTISIFFLFIIITFNFFEGGIIISRFSSIFSEFGSVISKTPMYEDSGSYRIIIWQHSIELLKSRPWLGYGPDTISKVITDYYNSDPSNLIARKIYFDKAHNEYLQIALASGIPALLIYLSFLTTILVKSVRKASSDTLVIFMIASLIGYFVQAFFNISVVSVAYIYWILLGALLNLIRQNNIQSAF